jgi:hypothetical protein
MRNPSKKPGATLMREVRGGRDTQEIALADGARVVVRAGAIAEMRDAEERLLVRYESGRAEIAAPAGDLVLSAPSGRVVLSAGADVHVEAQIVPWQTKVLVAP